MFFVLPTIPLRRHKFHGGRVVRKQLIFHPKQQLVTNTITMSIPYSTAMTVVDSWDTIKRENAEWSKSFGKVLFERYELYAVIRLIVHISSS